MGRLATSVIFYFRFKPANSSSAEDVVPRGCYSNVTRRVTVPHLTICCMLQSELGQVSKVALSNFALFFVVIITMPFYWLPVKTKFICYMDRTDWVFL